MEMKENNNTLISFSNQQNSLSRGCECPLGAERPRDTCHQTGLCHSPFLFNVDFHTILAFCLSNCRAAGFTSMTLLEGMEKSLILKTVKSLEPMASLWWTSWTMEAEGLGLSRENANYLSVSCRSAMAPGTPGGTPWAPQSRQCDATSGFGWFDFPGCLLVHVNAEMERKLRKLFRRLTQGVASD